MFQLRFIAVIILIITSASTIFGDEAPKVRDTLEVIQSRKSVRHFTDTPVSPEDIDKILRAGMAAPSAVNMQPWSFLVFTNKTKMSAIAAKLPFDKFLASANVCISVCTEPKKAFYGIKELSIIDACLAGENILLAIEALGLGGVWTGVYPDTNFIRIVREELEIPVDVIPLNIIAIGYPTGEDKPKDKYKPERIHFEKW